MTQAGSRRRRGPRAADDASRGPRLRPGAIARLEGARIGVLAAAGAAALALVLAELLPLYAIEVAGTSCAVAASPGDADACLRRGGEQHGFGLVPVALLVLAMGAGAALGGSRPAAMALVVCGVLVLAITLALDLPDTSATGLIGERFAEAEAAPGAGFYLQLGGAALALGAGAAALRRPRRRGAGA